MKEREKRLGEESERVWTHTERVVKEAQEEREQAKTEALGLLEEMEREKKERWEEEEGRLKEREREVEATCLAQERKEMELNRLLFLSSSFTKLFVFGFVEWKEN